jgi:peptidyl-prolyl cis-trans isomerase B (cyclophilin B)
MKTPTSFIARAGLVLATVVLLPGCGGGEDGDGGGMEPPIETITVSDADPGAANRPQVTLTITDGGSINGTVVITLVPEHAPLTVANFLAYVNSGFYDGTIIHRYQEDFVMQGGGYAAPVAYTDLPTTHKPVNDPIQLEIKVSNVLGTVAMARKSALNSATSEYFINLANNSYLDYSAGGYAAFGYITDFTLVDAIEGAMNAGTCVASNITNYPNGCLPVPNLVITSAVQTRL